jgi:hypothetical protein
MDTTLPEWFLKDKPAQPGKPIYEFWGNKGLKEPL